MIPMGWMAPLCIATETPWCSRPRATPRRPRCASPSSGRRPDPQRRSQRRHLFAQRGGDPAPPSEVRGVSFVGSTAVGRHIYATASANGKRVQCLTEAKNHALVLRDAALERTARGIVNSACGCAGERCMALPLSSRGGGGGPARGRHRKDDGRARDRSGLRQEEPARTMVNAEHRESVMAWVETGIKEGAKLAFDKRCVT